jgi:cardiolipin synthase A/B
VLARFGFVGLLAAAGCGLPAGVAPPTRTGTAARPVSLLVEPDDGPAAVLGLLDAARSSVWMEMYLLTDERAIRALAGRAAAGCDVRVILEPSPYENAGGNQDAYDELAAAGVDVRWASARFAYTHAKSFIVDHARLAVLTLNLTAAGLDGNREYAAIDDDPTDIAAAEAIFAADQIGARTRTPGGRLVSSPETSRPQLMGLLAGAQRSLAIETEELTDGEAMAVLTAALGRGVAVTLAWPGPAEPGSTFAALSAAGAVVRVATAPSIHGKVIVADGATAYVGSVNLTPTSLDENREIGLRLDDPSASARVAATVTADAAGGAPL